MKKKQDANIPIIHQLWIIARNGLHIYSSRVKRVIGKEDLKINGDMFSGFIAAINAFTSEIGLNNCRVLETKTNKLVFSHYHTLDLTFVGKSTKDIENHEIFEYLESVKSEFLSKYKKIIHNWNGSVAEFKGISKIIDIEKGDTTKSSYGIAFDIGTTTVVGYLINLSTGKELSAVAKTNPQAIHGNDIISRIEFAQQYKDGLEILQKEIVNILNEIIREAAQRAGINTNNIYKIAVAGNTCMHHLLLGLNPSYAALSPYIPVIKESFNLKIKDIPKLALKPTVNVYILPNISAFVGADISAGILATYIWRNEKTILFIDLGTNGEIILSSKKKLWACSTAAGPAFEGARISSGMRAAEGAIDKAKIDNKSIIYRVIKDGKVRGICGSGLIDLIAEMLKLALINKSGKLINREECNTELSEEIRNRIIKGQKGNKFLIVKGKETENGNPIYLTQGDIREVQLAKAAIYAGIKILLKKVNISTDDIQKILLAGAFGNFINKESARRIGLIPQLPLKKIELVGNAAGRGAEIALLSEKMKKVCQDIAKEAKYIELSSCPDFQKEYIKAMFF